MSAPTIAEMLKFANLQMAAEALYEFNATLASANLQPGKPFNEALDIERFEGILTDGNLHASTFTSIEAAKFAEQWRVVEHISNTTTGFSGTLFEDKISGELVLSFRSTEFHDDHARDNTATNQLEISKFGFAFGQIADMETWYGELKAAGKIPAGAQFSVTGYSLGGHLATIFNLLHQNELNGGQVMLFNGAGVGKIGTADGTLAGTQAKLREMVDTFAALRAQGAGGGFLDRFLSEAGRNAYLAIQAHLASTLGVPRAAVGGGFNEDLTALANGVRPSSPDDPYAAQHQYDYDLLSTAVARIKAVYEAARRAPTLNSGSNQGPSNPADIPDTAIAGESLDYQLAVRPARNDRAFAHESRRWRDGDPVAGINDNPWRKAA